MAKRWFVDVLVGLALALAGQFVQLAAGIVGPILGFDFPYEMAPEDGSIPQGLLDQISLMFWIAAVGMLALAFVVGLLVRVRGVAEGARRGVVWAAVVGLSQFLLGLGEGVVGVFTLPGTYAYLAAIVLGAVLAGLLPRPARRAAGS